MIQEQLSLCSYDFIPSTGKRFIAAFDSAMRDRGYVAGGITDGYCWGKHMVIYTKEGVKSKKSYARIYIKEGGEVVLRMYFSNIDNHRAYIEMTPSHVKQAFTGDYGVCGHCHNQKDGGACMHRKTYTIDHVLYEKCDGFTFEFHDVCAERIADYMALFMQFYPVKKKKASTG